MRPQFDVCQLDLSVFSGVDNLIVQLYPFLLLYLFLAFVEPDFDVLLSSSNLLQLLLLVLNDLCSQKLGLLLSMQVLLEKLRWACVPDIYACQQRYGSLFEALLEPIGQ